MEGAARSGEQYTLEEIMWSCDRSTGAVEPQKCPDEVKANPGGAPPSVG
jgi:hypothetical protein